jgi:hypothetical protein
MRPSSVRIKTVLSLGPCPLYGGILLKSSLDAVTAFWRGINNTTSPLVVFFGSASGQNQQLKAGRDMLISPEGISPKYNTDFDRLSSNNSRSKNVGGRSPSTRVTRRRVVEFLAPVQLPRQLNLNVLVSPLTNNQFTPVSATRL